MKKIVLFCWLLPTLILAQLGGKNGFEFVNYGANAKLAGIGAMNVSVRDSDPNMVFSNPALLNSDMKHLASVSYNQFYANIGNTQIVYAFDTKKLGLFGVGLQYTDYGTAKSTDASGADLGTISANEYAFTVSKSHTIGNYTLGANVKFAHSQIADQNAAMVLTDIGGVFKHPTRQFTIGLLVKNMGFALKNYHSNENINIPFDVQAGFSYKLEHMPLRFSMTIHHLHQFDIAYDDPNRIASYDLNGNPQYTRVGLADKVMRHFVFGGEFILTKGFHLRAGYNHFRRAEMAIENYSGLGGFSFGAMLKVKVVELGYTAAFYHAAGPRSHFTLIINLGGFYKKKEVPQSVPEIPTKS
ncbi:MAG: type IX secretion system protein PorQ [Cytophagales bacterium]